MGGKQIEISSSVIILCIKKFVLNGVIGSFISEEHIFVVLQMCYEEPGFVGCFLYGKGTNTGRTQSDIAFVSRKLLWHVLFLPSTQVIPTLLSSCRYL